MDQYHPYLEWIDQKRNSIHSLLKTWTDIPSASHSLPHLNAQAHALQSAFEPLGAQFRSIRLPPKITIQKDGSTLASSLGPLLCWSKRPRAPLKILLCGHMDIALSPTDTFLLSRKTSRDLLVGRGAADMKGGLLVVWLALQALENSPFATKIGWKLLVNPDEEIGSPGSKGFLMKEAKKHHIGLVFEPALPDGCLVGARKGSINYTVVVQGVASHAGRDFFKGLNALTAAARFALAAESLTDFCQDATVNIGYLEGGGAVNTVPDTAICRLNMRMKTKEEFKQMKKKIEQIAAIENRRGGAIFTLYQDTERAPKVFDKNARLLFESLKKCGASLGIAIDWKATGGVCDGNTLAEAGLPTIDTLGPIGGSLHTNEEYVRISSILQRAKLTARFLMQIGAGEIALHIKRHTYGN